MLPNELLTGVPFTVCLASAKFNISIPSASSENSTSLLTVGFGIELSTARPGSERKDDGDSLVEWLELSFSKCICRMALNDALDSFFKTASP